ncbi:MAG: radical SAM protein [Richelia sp. RM2_1_2]|nr:radical SAM protein [Richelia sp. RM2_1_2]
MEITEKCNLSCSHCYAESSPQGELYGSMSYEDWCNVIDEAAELGCRKLQFIGGEPTIHPRLDDLVDYANHRGYEFIEVFTNATRLNKGLIDCFQSYGVHIATSFYSDDPTVHEEITHSRGSWEQTVKGIQAALIAGIPVRVGVIETNQNIGHGTRAINFVKKLGVASVSIDREREIGRGGLTQFVREDERYDQLCGQCWKGKLCVTSSGDVFPCVFSRATRIGNVASGLQKLVQSTNLQQFRSKIRDLEAQRAVSSCAPNTNCTPDNCSPTLPCNPQGPFCSPDSTCTPGTRCQPS